MSDPVEAARKLVPLLREHAAETDRTAAMPETVVNELRNAGLLSLGAPAAVGGPEADLPTAFEVYRNLARGCGSSAWVAMVLSTSAQVAAALGDEGRQELWGTDAFAGVCSSLVPVGGKARESAAGVHVTGRWLPLSGVHQSRWAVVAAVREQAEPVLAVVPVAAGTVERTWAMSGMRATRSDTLVLDDVFVPRRRVLPIRTLVTGSRPFMPGALVALAAPLLGMAEFAVEQATEWLRGQRAGGGSSRAASPAVLHTLTTAAARVDVAHVVLSSLLTDTERINATGEPASDVFRGRIRMLVARAVADLREAVHGSLTVLGGDGLVISHPAERVWRDMETACTHAMVSMERALDEYGPLLLSEQA
ncbi:MAG TPA: acyl-CoA dehydrogenase family protein [Pseudonocardiaceae bacterium]|nr:acyl-CoA dehydrogenase family protein [Pseudonocardiaceae bacterium]